MPSILVPSRKLVAPRFAQRGTPFNRKAWDNPVRYKLDRAYGDEFDYASFTQLRRRWEPISLVATDFDFPGSSAVAMAPSAMERGIRIAAPAGDFEAVLQTQIFGNVTNAVWPMIALIDGVGTGAGGGLYSDGNLYAWPLTGYLTGSPAAVTSGYALNGSYQWLCVRRTGTSLTVRSSSNGTSLGGFSSGVTVSATAPYLAIIRANPGGAPTNGSQWILMHRLNVYPGPTFFQG